VLSSDKIIVHVWNFTLVYGFIETPLGTMGLEKIYMGSQELVASQNPVRSFLRRQVGSKFGQAGIELMPVLRF
jgi:hypothetical protein